MGASKEDILNWYEKNLSELKGMNVDKIYKKICDNFYIEDYSIASECSHILVSKLN